MRRFSNPFGGNDDGETEDERAQRGFPDAEEQGESVAPPGHAAAGQAPGEEPAPIGGQGGDEPIRWGSGPPSAESTEAHGTSELWLPRPPSGAGASDAQSRGSGDGEGDRGEEDRSRPAGLEGTSAEEERTKETIESSPYFSSSERGPVEPLSSQERDDDEDRLSRHVPLPSGGQGDEEQAGSGEFAWEEPARASAEDGPGDGGRGEERREEPGSRVSVVDEPHSRPAPPVGASEEEYRWHTYKVYPSGRPDAVEFIDTYKAFGKNRILRGLNMGLPEGMVSMILGPSGTGKSVCIKHMVGLLYPDEGDILVHGHSVPNMPDDDLFEMRKKFGLLFQDGALFGSMNLYDNVAFPLRQHTEKGEDEIEDIVMRRLNEVGLGSAREKLPNELSGGMRKRAGFARALVLEPDIVLFDEPDSGLDPVRTALLGELILEIHRDMMEEAKDKQREHLPTFAVITHDIMSARRVADYINVLWKGRIVEAGPAEDMLNSENPFIRQFLAGESQGPLTMD
jgi:phospholipid/cholesterol/gamma-HCH transport system ATP-binding protein